MHKTSNLTGHYNVLRTAEKPVLHYFQIRRWKIPTSQFLYLAHTGPEASYRSKESRIRKYLIREASPVLFSYHSHQSVLQTNIHIYFKILGCSPPGSIHIISARISGARESDSMKSHVELHYYQEKVRGTKVPISIANGKNFRRKYKDESPMATIQVAPLQ